MCRSHFQDVGTLHGFQPGLPQVLHDRIRAKHRRVVLREPFQDLGALLRRRDAGEETVGVEVVHAGHRHPRHRERAEHAGTKADRGDNILFARVEFTGCQTQPALGTRFVRLTGVPDVHRAEVRPHRVRIAHPMDDRHLPLVVHVTDGAHAGVQSDIVVQEEYLVFREPDDRAIVPIQWVLVGNNRVQIVVPA